MKIELKREDPIGAAKEDKTKEATGNQVRVIEQALPVDEEEEDILKPYYAHLTPAEIEAFRIIETVRVQNKYLTREIFCYKRTPPSSGASSVYWRIS